MTDAGGFDGDPNLDPDLDDDARWALLERNLEEQGRLAQKMEQTRLRAVARGVARETVDRLGRAGRDDELATEVADAVLDAVLHDQVVPEVVAAPVLEEGSDQGDGRVAAQQRPIRLRVRTWQLVDAVLDNVISVRTQSGVGDDEVEYASRLRERGWRVNAEHPRRELGEAGWPPDDEYLSIACTDDDRHFILGRLDEALETARVLASTPQAAAERRECERKVSLLERVREEVQSLAADDDG